MKTVMMGCPVQNRSWIIPYYLTNLAQQTHPKKKIHIAFLHNTPREEDDHTTLDLLLQFKDAHKRDYHKIDIIHAEGNWKDRRVHGRFFTYFAEIRNLWLQMLRKTDSHIFSVDSDILLPPTSLRKLLGWDKDIISALINNGPIPESGQIAYNFMTSTDFKYNNGDTVYLHMPTHILESTAEWKRDPESNFDILINPPQVPMTGACSLMKREVIDAGVRYGYHIQGEDVYFCERAREAGFKLYTDFMLQPAHIMSPGQLQKMLEDIPENMVVRASTDFTPEAEDKVEVEIIDRY